MSAAAQDPRPRPAQGVRRKQVLDGVDLDVMPGTSMVVIGGSGTGKSVLLKCILGLIEPDAGTIEIDGRDILSWTGGARGGQAAGSACCSRAARCSTACRSGRTSPSACWPGELTRAEARARAGEVLAQVGLDPSVGDLSPAELSGGMQKRVGLARAIAAQPGDPVLRRADDGARPDHGRGDRRADRGLREAPGQHRDRHHPRHGQRDPHRRPRGDAVPRPAGLAGQAADLLDSGNAMVDQFTHGRREGPIQMELRR